MLLARINGTHPIHRLRNEVESLMNDMLSDATRLGAWGTCVFPPLNIWENDECLFAEAELPGLKMEDIEVEVLGDELTIKGRFPRPEARDETFHRRERACGEFARTVRLPVEIDADKVEASLRDGILTITLPKSAAARPRKIEVKTASE